MSANAMTPDEADVFGARVIKELLEACPASDGGPHQWRATDVGESVEPLAKDRLGRGLPGGPMSVWTNLAAECICGVTVRAMRNRHVETGSPR